MNICQTESESVKMLNYRDSENLIIHKRQNQWDNEVYKEANDAEYGKNNFYGDRFIPKRFTRNNIELNQNFVQNNEIEDVMTLNYPSSYWRQNNFIATLNNAFGIEKRRLLQFAQMPSYKVRVANENPPRWRFDMDWPCRPRPKPLTFADATHDLPEFDSLFECNLMDWSQNDQIAVSFGHDVIIWKSRDDVTMVFNLKWPSSLAYSPNGEYLAIGCIDCHYPVVELWKVSSSNEFFVVDGKVFDESIDSVSCLEWSKCGNELLCGTKTGCIFVLSVPSMRMQEKIQRHSLPINVLKFSPIMRYLASSDIQGNVIIFRWTTREVFFQVRSRLRSPVTLDWHPWNGVDLAISEMAPASLIILHVPKREIVAIYQRCDTKMAIYSVNFSKLTGELLVSISKRDDNGAVKFVVLVMSSLSRVVDELDIPESGVRFMMWSPDGTRLATAGLDESLSIWNFIPGHKSNKMLQRKRNSNQTKFDDNSELMKWMRFR